ncbi:65-kDa microtubule-associated protein 7-like [Zingiber officinale]|uniref:65-kDa microtubule-associated protein 7-like n=1 Tax=Zingiber officinale TaxID=94328 RepID=UPI001C4BED56|nr:65-kDa microtubule-associated protein 7-like [Zingiber officinale]
MKELVSGERSEMEEACRRTHIEPEMSTAPEKACALLDSCLVDPSELLANIGKHILKVKQEYVIRKEIIDRVNKWLLACEEEGWLQEYDKDTSKCTAGRGTHLNLKRAENARVTVSKIPANSQQSNEQSICLGGMDEKNMVLLYGGVRSMSILQDDIRQRKD